MTVNIWLLIRQIFFGPNVSFINNKWHFMYCINCLNMKWIKDYHRRRINKHRLNTLRGTDACLLISAVWDTRGGHWYCYPHPDSPWAGRQWQQRPSWWQWISLWKKVLRGCWRHSRHKKSNYNIPIYMDHRVYDMCEISFDDPYPMPIKQDIDRKGSLQMHMHAWLGE